MKLTTALAFSLVTVAAYGQVLEKIPPRYGHLLYLPKRTWASHKRWPLILYLHGKSLRGNDLGRVSAYGLPKRLRTDKGFPFIVVCPQLPSDQRWTDTKALASLVNSIADHYPVDRRRIYAIGFSMGASGVWRVAHDYPRMFAAVVSVGGMYEKPLASDGRLRAVPIWMIHGSDDTEASPSEAKATFALYQKAGGKGRLTMVAGKGHDIPTVLERGDVYHWLLHNQVPSPSRVPLRSG